MAKLHFYVSPTSATLAAVVAFAFTEIFTNNRRLRLVGGTVLDAFAYPQLIEKEKLGRLYRPGEHLTKAMYNLK